jgi:hypothetical protein
LESKAGPDSINVFNSVSRPSKFFPAVALFGNLSYLPSLKEELMIRNRGLKGKIESVSVLQRAAQSLCGAPPKLKLLSGAQLN